MTEINDAKIKCEFYSLFLNYYLIISRDTDIFTNVLALPVSKVTFSTGHIVFFKAYKLKLKILFLILLEKFCTNSVSEFSLLEKLGKGTNHSIEESFRSAHLTLRAISKFPP